jgi:hypothetical protein
MMKNENLHDEPSTLTLVTSDRKWNSGIERMLNDEVNEGTESDDDN